MALPRASFHRWRDDWDAPTGNLARWVFVATAIAFAIIGAATAVWISRANVADIFYFGSTGLWSAMDPAGFYLPDVILFFEPGALAHDHHPGLTMTGMAAVLARAVYAGTALFADQEPSVEFWVRHRILLNAMLAGLADAMWLACCHPLFKVLRHFMHRSAAYVGCTLFLTSVPVLVYLSRFSPEAWMLYFSLWSIHLSLRGLDGHGETRLAAAMGVCTALAVLSKWLALPIVALNLFSLLRAPDRHAPTVRNLFAYALAAAVPAALLLSKLSFPHLAEGLALQMRASPGIARTFALPHQHPFLIHNALVFGAGALGLTVIFFLQAPVRTKLAALLATLVLMAVLIVRRPLWHYFFGFYWLFPAAAAYGLTLLLTRRAPRRRDGAAVAAGFVIIAACNAWAYPDIIGTYARYRDSFGQRAALVKLHPAWVAAPWEYALNGFEATRDPARVFPFYGHRLETLLQSQRRHEDRAHHPRSTR
jgi:hypothetical protein